MTKVHPTRSSFDQNNSLVHPRIEAVQNTSPQYSATSVHPRIEAVQNTSPQYSATRSSSAGIKVK